MAHFIDLLKGINMFTNAKLTEKLALLAALNPASVAPGTVLTAWVLAANFHSIAALIQTGVLGASATINASLQQALDSSGTSAMQSARMPLRRLCRRQATTCKHLLNAAQTSLIRATASFMSRSL